MTTMRFHYAQDVDTVYRFLADPETARKRSVDFGETDIRVTTQGNTVVNVRKVAMDVPAIAKKILNPVNTVTDTKAWDPATKTARMSVDIQGAPIKVDGQIRVVPSGSGADYIMDFQVTCKIPLIGGQIEKLATAQTEEGMHREDAWNRKQLGG